MLDDATLNDVCGFGNHCWAVGERGVILKSTDKGCSWQVTSVPRDGSLKSVCFLTDQIGYVAGSTFDTMQRRHRGVLLATRDSGDSWFDLTQNTSVYGSGLPGPGLPPLSFIRFFDLENAVAIGATDDLYSGSQILKTSDGGKTWKSTPQDNAHVRWRSGDFVSPHDGIVVGNGNAAGSRS